ncbi:signal transduction histidine kinase, nitrogen specific, NtrB [Caldithrix abyssi DSM 13497]|uniref:histidine kinase n=1 Tax=Caldithrix abyssi DSM 13497 TaxID=880073 RepID=H1XR80_CALAY|nr:HAMP domain-containing sensor histidine kinase [Caldithrix abyssi]APF17083.1 HAMP domain-containing protein [Caldithrix abyssi DSM 13497]EHO41231.1 signal transduction histidine kinase, nitrogen specific, NtrB [Caldithrix abyssi DSM 13497]
MFDKISFKLILTILVVVVLVFFGFAIMSLKTQKNLVMSQVKNFVNTQSETIKNSTKMAMLSNNREVTHEIIRTVGQHPSIQEVRILNKEGHVMYAADSAEIGIVLDKKAEACYSCHESDRPLERLSISERVRIYRPSPDSDRIMGIINPIYNEPSCWQADCHAHPESQKVLGVLDLTVCLKQVDEEIAHVTQQMILMAILAIIILGIVLWLLIKKFVDQPVKKLLTATRQVASGNLSYTIPDLGNDELGILARSFNNMTRKLAEARQQLFQSDKMASLGRLAAGVAHEINNPLTGILTYASFLLKRTKDQPELHNDLQVIVRETIRSREIVKGLLDFARQSIPKKVRSDIHQVIERAVTVLENQLTLNHIQLEKKYAPRLPQIAIDPNQMQQVFTNLIVNAQQAIGSKGGKITISTALVRLSPYGKVQIKQALCPKGHDLMDEHLRIDGLPSIKLKIRLNGEEGFVHLDPIYGRNNFRSEISIKNENPEDIVCPKCNISLIDKDQKCPKCEAQVYTLEIPGKGQLHGCITDACQWQYWDAVEKQGPRDYIEIKVSDTGCGIPPEIVHKIFDPFFTTKGQQGTGLGLAVIWGILENHEGTISVKSKVGKGTTFTIHLPVQTG